MSVENSDGELPERRRGGPLTFFREVQAEGRKVTWATRNEVTVSTIMVLIMGLMAALFFFLVDSVLRFLLNVFLNLSAPQ
jgi:preprotein translocase subunit SecE